MLAFLRHTGIALAAGAVFASASAAAFAASTPQQMALQAMVGTWTCVTHGSDGKTWHETDVDTMWGVWLKTEATYPAQNGQPAATGTGILGYDAKHHRWYGDGADTNGGYGSGYSNSSGLGGSKWHDGYPDNNGSATISMSKNQYVVDSKGPNDQGKTITSHQVCTKG